MPEKIGVEIENVRCIRQSKLEFPVRSLTVLVGTNNAGKSSILEVLSKAFWAISSRSDSGFINTSFYRRSAQATFCPTVGIDMPIRSLLDNADEFVPRGERLHVKCRGALPVAHLDPGVLRRTRFMPVGMSLVDGRDSLDLLSCSADVDQYDLESTAYISVDSRLMGSNWKKLEFEQHGSVSGASIEHFYGSKNPLTKSLKDLSQRVFYLPAVRDPSFGPDAHESKLSEATLFSPTKLLKRLHYDQPRWLGLVSGVSLMFDNVDDLVMRDTDHNLAPHVKLRTGEVVPLNDMGFGMRNAIHLLTVVCAAPVGSIIMIDEPEQGLNQSRQSDFAVLLESIRSDLTLIVATQAEAFCKGLGSSNVYIVEPSDDIGASASAVQPVSLAASQDRRRLAKAMGINPIYLLEGGKIIYVEGPSDREILQDWLRVNLGPLADRAEVQSLGGTGKIGEEFAKPMFRNFKDQIFFMLDSDGESDDEPMSSAIRLRVNWFRSVGISNYVIANRRELENYIGHEKVALASGILPQQIRPLPGREKWQDLKKAVRERVGYYDEKKITVTAYKLLEPSQQKCLYGDDNDAFLAKVQRFLTDGH
ncbi:AAA family ATPase [Sorangium sp. So ce260]|uniref:ATP-dependent nuclease n=1 Tax=Sorangium sp. So ce260 TaxID=3133291 RepID=UPI003F627F40